MANAKSVLPRRRPARVSGNTLRSSGKESPKSHGSWCMPRERSKPRHAPSPFPKGTEGIACTQPCASCRNTRSLSERSTELDASSARGAKARGCGCHPQEGSQRARLSEHGTKVPREFWRAPQTKRVREGSFFRQALSLSQQRKCGKTANGSSLPLQVAIRQNKRPRASNASRVPQQNKTAYYRPQLILP